jgi:hypothetical protein
LIVQISSDAGCVRASDTVSRDGGDEFIVLLSEVEHPETVATVANRMMQAVAKPHSIDQHDLHVTTSIGVSVDPQDGLDAITLIKNADTAMYQAKENGRSALRFFQQPMNVRAVERQSMEEDLRPDLYEQAKAYEKPNSVNGNTFYWSDNESLSELERPERMAQIEENWAKTQARLLKRQKNRTLAETLGGLEVIPQNQQGCLPTTLLVALKLCHFRVWACRPQ